LLGLGNEGRDLVAKIERKAAQLSKMPATRSTCYFFNITNFVRESSIILREVPVPLVTHEQYNFTSLKMKIYFFDFLQLQ
jgi:hypothetical protein